MARYLSPDYQHPNPVFQQFPSHGWPASIDMARSHSQSTNHTADTSVSGHSFAASTPLSEVITCPPDDAIGSGYCYANSTDSMITHESDLAGTGAQHQLDNPSSTVQTLSLLQTVNGPGATLDAIPMEDITYTGSQTTYPDSVTTIQPPAETQPSEGMQTPAQPGATPPIQPNYVHFPSGIQPLSANNTGFPTGDGHLLGLGPDQPRYVSSYPYESTNTLYFDQSPNQHTVLQGIINEADAERSQSSSGQSSRSPRGRKPGKTSKSPLIEKGLSSTQRQRSVCQICGNRSFSRPADLARHISTEHTADEDKKLYLCDYRKCERHHRPTQRLDHFREHLRDYHKEDLLPTRGKKEKLNQAWWEERSRIAILSGWWRCPKCFRRVPEEQQVCECTHKIEQERQQWREWFKEWKRTCTGGEAEPQTPESQPEEDSVLEDQPLEYNAIWGLQIVQPQLDHQYQAEAEYPEPPPQACHENLGPWPQDAEFQG